MATPETVVHVDPSAADRQAVHKRLTDEGLAVDSYCDLDGATGIFEEQSIDCVITEAEFADGTGFDLLERVRSAAPDTGCLLYTGADRSWIRERAPNVLAASISKQSPQALDRLAQITVTTARERSQTAYPLPRDEPRRLEAIAEHAFDDPLLQRSLDRIVDQAAAQFDMPWASVGIVRERCETFPASHGIEFGHMDRQETICTYTILDQEVTVIEDVAEDPRLADHDSLQVSDIAFYAGAPIELGLADSTEPGSSDTTERAPVGTVCVYDDHPREFSDADRDTLSTLADLAADVIRFRSTAALAEVSDP